MGYSLPAAIVAQLLNPGRPVVCFMGDGGLAMVQGELRLAASLGLALLVVVFCDNSLNRIEIKQANRKYPSWGTLIEPTDIERLAQSMGCEGAMVDSAAALQRLLAAKRPKDRPLVVGAQHRPGAVHAAILNIGGGAHDPIFPGGAGRPADRSPRRRRAGPPSRSASSCRSPRAAPARSSRAPWPPKWRRASASRSSSTTSRAAAATSRCRRWRAPSPTATR